MNKQSFIHIPNNIFNHNLLPSELLTFCSILSIQNEYRKASASFKALSELSGLSVATVQRNISALCNKQLISQEKRFYYDGKNRSNLYTVIAFFGRGFFRIPRCVIKSYLAPSAFTVLCYICKCADKSGHAYPSLNKISTATRLTINTIVEHLDALVKGGFLRKHLYVCNNGCFGCNQYSISGLRIKQHRTVMLKLKRGFVLVSCWQKNRLDLQFQYELLKGVECTKAATNTGALSITSKAYHKKTDSVMGTVILSKQVLYPFNLYQEDKRIKPPDVYNTLLPSRHYAQAAASEYLSNMHT